MADQKPSIFTRIFNGEIPGRIVWRDHRCVVMVDIRPLATGHVLVIPIEQVDQWTDVDPDLAAHLFAVAHRVGGVQKKLFSCARVGLMIAGFEVPHTHLHLVPMNSMTNLDFSTADPDVPPAVLDKVAKQLEAALA